MLTTLAIAFGAVVGLMLFVTFLIWLNNKSPALVMVFFVLALWAVFEWMKRANIVTF